MKRPKRRAAPAPRRITRSSLVARRAIANTPREQLALPGATPAPRNTPRPSDEKRIEDHPALNPFKNSKNAHVRNRGWSKVISLRIAPDLLDALDIFVERNSAEYRRGWLTRTRVIENAIRKHINGGAAAPRRS